MPATDSNNAKPSVLKSTRQAKGLTLEVVHEATKIPMDALRAIEDGYSVRILSPFYYRGFIKIYSEFLGLNVGEMYKQYGIDTAPPKADASVKTPVKPARKPPAQSNMAIEQMQEWFSAILKPGNVKLFFKVIVFLFLSFLLFKTAGCVVSHMNKKAVHPKQSVIWKEKRVEINKDVQEEKRASPPQEIKHEVLPVQSENNKVELAVRAIRNTWIQVRQDGQVVFQMTLNKGSMESWSAENRIELSGKNIDQLDMEVNGKHIGSLGGGEHRIRKVVITREGLTVKK
ncbi:MAG: DUF4115 domain-containing protein [Candidatus Omnitrophica bacterium]|nr:DUF4115 domain-containing protein [Candidatus Omnitrophota bacterium]